MLYLQDKMRWSHYMLHFLIATVLLLLPLIYLVPRWKAIKRYAVVLSLVVTFAAANVYTASIPIALYAADFKCGYLKDMYAAVLAGSRVVSNFSDKFQLLIWHPYVNTVPHPDAACHEKIGQIQEYGGIPMGEEGVLGAVAMIAGSGGQTVGINSFSEQAGLLRETLNTMPDSKHWSQFAPPEIRAHPNRPIGNSIPYMLLRTASLSHFLSEKFWLHVFPNHYKWAIMDHLILSCRYNITLENAKIPEIHATCEKKDPLLLFVHKKAITASQHIISMIKM